MLVEIATSLMLLTGPAPEPAPAAATRLIRPLSGIAQFLVDEAKLRSPTVGRLIADLRRHNVIVYVELDGLRNTRGATSIISSTPVVRYLRIVISIKMDLREQIEVLGHELHHALEIAQAAEAVDEPSLRALFDKIGYRSGQGFETDAARAIEGEVRRDLSRQSAAGSMATSARREDPDQRS